ANAPEQHLLPINILLTDRLDDSDNFTKAFQITYTVGINKIQNLNSNGALTFKATFNFWWINPFLTWITDITENVTVNYNIDMANTVVWYPIMTLVNCEQPDCILVPDQQITINLASNGKSVIEFEAFQTATCELNMTLFPFDEQNCTIDYFLSTPDAKYYVEF